MSELYDKSADHFLELASPQRLQILFSLLDKKSTITALAKELNSTKQEVHRNFVRLKKSSLIVKNVDGNYALTTFGRTMCTQVPSLILLSKNMGYFVDHIFGDIPTKFIMRSGQLANGTHVKGFSKIMEHWQSMYNNANEYIYQILSEVILDRTEAIIKRVQKGITFSYVMSEFAIVPKGRKKLLTKMGFSKLIEKGLVDRKMKKNVQTLVVVTEKEACVLFPKSDGEPDLSEMFYSDDPMFHEWCLDYYRYCWYNSDSFQESKLKE